MAEEISWKALSTSLDKTNKEFTLKLYKNSNAVTFRIQVHSSLYNVTCFKYGATLTEKCQFDFFCPYIEEIKVTELGSINISLNNLWINL